MKSTIRIALDEQGTPVLRINYAQSEDLRDEVVKRFLEGFDKEKSIATLFYENGNIAVIKPLVN